jgi:hypothetical protein
MKGGVDERGEVEEIQHRKRKILGVHSGLGSCPLVKIRMMIYRAALVRPEAIDLWPQDYVENPADDLLLAPRIAKARAEVRMDTYIPRFCSQHDLQYVQKTMATGLLATCRQVYRDAVLLFWCENTLRGL